jgi:hypothetical protein
MDVSAGWNGVLRVDKYAPFIVGLENTGKKLSCRVSVDVTTGRELRGNLSVRTFSQALTIPARSRKRLFFVVPISTTLRPVVVRVDSGGSEIARTVVDVGGMIEGNGIVVAVSSELSLDYLSGLLNEARVVYPHVDNLPESWAGYDGVDVVVVHDMAFQGLRRNQVNALEQWVFAGGTLVVSGGPAALQLKSSGLERLLPVRVTGTAPFDRLPSLAGLVGAYAVPRGSMILAASTLVSGTVEAEEKGMPILATRRLGRGAVRFLAFDCAQAPMAGWQGNAALWRLLSEKNERLLASKNPVDTVSDPWMKLALQGSGSDFPPGYAIVGIFILYTLVAAVMTGVRDVRLKASGRAVLLIVTAVLFSAAGWFVSNRVLYAGETRLEIASVAWSVSGDGLAWVTEKLGIFSTSGGVYDISIPHTSAVVQETGTPPGNVEIEQGDRNGFRVVGVKPFSGRLFTIEDVVEFQARVAIRQDATGRRVTVENASPHALKGSFLALGGDLYLVGEIPAGGRLERVLNAGDRESAAIPDPLKLAFWRNVRGGLEGKGPILVAWLDVPLLALSVPRGAETGSDLLHLVAVEAR